MDWLKRNWIWIITGIALAFFAWRYIRAKMLSKKMSGVRQAREDKKELNGQEPKEQQADHVSET